MALPFKHASMVLLATGALAQFVPAPTDLITKEGYAGINVRYKEVPTGICEMDPDVKSYSGYADVAENQHIFWCVCMWWAPSYRDLLVTGGSSSRAIKTLPMRL